MGAVGGLVTHCVKFAGTYIAYAYTYAGWAFVYGNSLLFLGRRILLQYFYCTLTVLDESGAEFSLQ